VLEFSSRSFLFFSIIFVLSFFLVFADQIIFTQVACAGSFVSEDTELKDIVPEDVCEDTCLVINYGDSYKTYAARIKELFVVPQFLEEMTFNADICMQPEEFFYLVDIQKNSFVTADEIIHSLWYLFKKNIFSTITIFIKSSHDNLVQNGMRLHFDLKSFLTLGRIKIRGIFTNKQAFQHCYGIDRGDRFDVDRHERSLEKMRVLCRNEGYFNALVTAAFSHTLFFHQINPTITINKGKQFSIESIFVEVQSDGLVSNRAIGDSLMAGEQKAYLEKKIYRIFLKRLLHKKYNKKFLESIVVEMQKYLSDEGYEATTITFDEQLDIGNASMRLNWHIGVQHKYTSIFWGNSFFSDNQLQQCIIDFGRSARLIPTSLLVQEIERLYKDSGFWKVSVEVQKEQDRCFFMITEGPRVLIEKIEFTETIALGAPLLITNCFGDFLKNRYFDQKLLNMSLEQVKKVYEEHGFLDIKIGACEYSVLSGDNPSGDNASGSESYVARFSIEQGRVKRIVAVEIPGFVELCDQEPFCLIRDAKGGVVFQPQLLKEQRLFLQKYFQEMGYRVTRLDSELRIKETIKEIEDKAIGSVSEDKDCLVIVWHIETDRIPLQFGKTIIQGCCAYSFDKLIRELQYERGQLWYQEAIKSTFLRFKNRKLFDEIYMFYDRNNIINREKIVLLRLHDDDPIEVRLRAGLGLQSVYKYKIFDGFTYKLGGSFIGKNVTNRGDLLALDIDCARSHRELVLKYSLPWVFGLPFDCLMQAYSIMHDQVGSLRSDHRMYTMMQHGFLVGIGKKTEHLDGGINIGIEGMSTKIFSDSSGQRSYIDSVARAINFTPILQDQLIPFFFIEPTVYIDYLDDKINPKRGSYSLFSCKGMISLQEKMAESSFVKLLAEQAFFVPFSRFVLALRMRFGHIFYQNFSAIMPTERFYLGGSHSLRGYDADAAPPLGCFVDKKGVRQLVPQGGKTMMNGNMEIRIPIISQLSAVFFQDIGMLSKKGISCVRSEHLLAATGFGARLHTPVGPLRFDIGFNWNRVDASIPRFAWFLSFGQAF